ncbi:MAG: YbaB/EbfC family nucleoid-associated protein [Hamadaea sp.]|uniref:YbaB/EbfC family nucleoid-associated protein n=1 Tax=Hamadaea sp. TaxID=2024425 RepID=UPI001853DC66|nr:YbaB/EbfC family nucleoid-associated protein [Hamadaea sp.]NUR74384.1 YbaB/EbfC family nucleoid-associated protein [Hamadaea sp.]NUT21569.1 YbaB/EbfC family nucleoid-associated protein [Hamadaea sp.]
MAGLNNLDGLAHYAMDQVDRLRRAQERLEHASAEGRSQDGLVVARTGAGGMLRELRIDESALRGGAEQVSRSVTAAITAAQAAYNEQADEIMGGEMGMRPSESSSEFDRGIARIDDLTDQLESLTRRMEH